MAATLPGLMLAGASAFAGGPLVIAGPQGHTAVSYANPNIVLNVDPGPLGARSNATADSLLQQAFQVWNAVPTATVHFSQGADLGSDITLANASTVLPDLANTVLHAEDGLNPVVYDSDGSIIDAYLGVGQSDTIIGFAASIVFENGTHFLEGYAVLNGRDTGLTDREIQLLITHELGHLIGLDHSQADINNTEKYFGNPGLCTTSLANRYPVMYPYTCRHTDTLHSDDLSAVSAMYPTADFASHYTRVSGYFSTPDGHAILGANIWLENIKTGEVYSTVSDYLEQGNGYYQLYAPPGDYRLWANSINPEFTGGSGVGPYTQTSQDKSFQAPHPIGTVSYHGSGVNPSVITVGAQAVEIHFDSQGGIGTATPTPALASQNSQVNKTSGGGALGGLPMLMLVVMCLGRQLRRQLRRSPVAA